jgi:hypothetical protein
MPTDDDDLLPRLAAAYVEMLHDFGAEPRDAVLLDDLVHAGIVDAEDMPAPM